MDNRICFILEFYASNVTASLCVVLIIYLCCSRFGSVLGHRQPAALPQYSQQEQIDCSLYLSLDLWLNGIIGNNLHQEPRTHSII